MVRGRVQGVFYRSFTRNVALKLGLQGWVRNNPDGSVEAVFEGDTQLIEQAVQECRRGPIGSRVTEIDISRDEQLQGHAGFEIRY